MNDDNAELDLEKRKFLLEKGRTWIELVKWLIGGAVIVTGFLLIKPQEQKRLDQQLRLQAITVYLDSLSTENIDLWQRKLDGIKQFFSESDTAFVYIKDEQTRLDLLRQQRSAIDQNKLVETTAKKIVEQNPGQNQQYQDIAQQATETIRLTEQDLQKKGVNIQKDQEFPYVFAIAGSFPSQEAAKSFVNNLPKDMPYKPGIYKLRENLYVVQVDSDLTVTEAEERVRYLKEKGIAPDAFVFRSRTPRQNSSL